MPEKDSKNREKESKVKVKPELRMDFISLRKNMRKTTQGFVRIPAAFTRTGVLNYRRADGTVVKELRHPEDVLHEDSIDSLRSAPVVVSHDIADVNPANYRDVQVGFASDLITAEKVSDESHLVGEVVIQRADTVTDINDGKLVEMSPVYSTVIDKTPGVYKGRHYDQRQRFIKYNNVALGPAGWGRSGKSVALRLDGAIDDEEIVKMDETEVKIRLDGDIEIAVKVPSALAGTLATGMLKLHQREDAAKAKIAELTGAIEVTKGELAETKTRLDAAMSPEKVEELVNERVSVVEKAKRLEPELKLDGLSTDEIRVKVLETRRKDTDWVGQHTAYTAGAFAALSTESAPVEYPRSKPAGKRQDGGDKDPAEVAHDRMVKRNRGEKVE